MHALDLVMSELTLEQLILMQVCKAIARPYKLAANHNCSQLQWSLHVPGGESLPWEHSS